MNIRIFSLVFSLGLTFAFNVFAAGAGVCPIFDDGQVLLGKERRFKKYEWSDFGGKQERARNGQLISLAETAWREFKEETAHYTFPNITLTDIRIAEANGHYADHIHIQSGQTYRTYFVWIHGPKPSIQSIMQNARLAKQRLGLRAHVEKVEWKYFNAQAIRNAPQNNGQLPGVADRLFAPFNAVLRTPAAQQFLQNYINAVNALRRPQPTRVNNPPVQVGKKAPRKPKVRQIKRGSPKANGAPRAALKRPARAARRPNLRRAYVRKQRPVRHIVRKRNHSPRRHR